MGSRHGDPRVRCLHLVVSRVYYSNLEGGGDVILSSGSSTVLMFPNLPVNTSGTLVCILPDRRPGSLPVSSEFGNGQTVSRRIRSAALEAVRGRGM